VWTSRNFGKSVRHSPIRFAGTGRDLLNDDRLLSVVCGEENPLITHASSEYAVPFRTVEGLHVAPERVGGHLCENAGHALLNGFRQAAKVSLGVDAELTDPIHV
jgi:hypothetical protein